MPDAQASFGARFPRITVGWRLFQKKKKRLLHLSHTDRSVFNMLPINGTMRSVIQLWTLHVTSRPLWSASASPTSYGSGRCLGVGASLTYNRTHSSSPPLRPTHPYSLGFPHQPALLPSFSNTVSVYLLLNGLIITVQLQLFWNGWTQLTIRSTNMSKVDRTFQLR